jgi:hypothetical protein
LAAEASGAARQEHVPAPPLSLHELLSRASELLAGRADADAVALRSGQLLGAPGDLAAFVGGHTARRVLGRATAAALTPAAAHAEPRVLGELSRLVASVRLHAGASREVARFGQALGCLGPLEDLACTASGRPAAAAGAPAAPLPRPAGNGAAGAATAPPQRLRLPSLPAALLVPPAIAAAAGRLAALPGLGPLLAWTSEGAFLADLGAEGGQPLGRPLLDFQVWIKPEGLGQTLSMPLNCGCVLFMRLDRTCPLTSHRPNRLLVPVALAGMVLTQLAPLRCLPPLQAPQLHLLLWEACDILGHSPPPRLHVLQSEAAPRVHTLAVPEAWASPPPREGSAGGRAGVLAWRRQGVIIVSSGALALPAAELQAALGGALLPLRAPGAGGDWMRRAC